MDSIIVDISTNIFGIHISTKLEGQIAHLTIKDNGIGMSEEKISKIFTKFYQGDNSMTREHGGTGLGLALCKGIVESHGGQIWIRSDGINKGSEVHVMLPRTKIICEKVLSPNIDSSFIHDHDVLCTKMA